MRATMDTVRGEISIIENTWAQYRESVQYMMPPETIAKNLNHLAESANRLANMLKALDTEDN